MVQQHRYAKCCNRCSTDQHSVLVWRTWLGWGHPTGSMVRTSFRHPGEDTHPASFPAATDMWLASVTYSRLELCTLKADFSTDCQNSATWVVPVLVLLLVALWFILWGDLLYVFPCVILFLCFSVLLVLRLPRLGKRELILVLFVRLFGLCLFRFVGFLFLLGAGKGCGLWLWHSLDFSLTLFLQARLLFSHEVWAHRPMSGHARSPCLGQMTQLWSITRHRFKPTQ